MTNTFIEGINLDSFKLIPSDAFDQGHKPIMTIYNDAFTFSPEAHKALNYCDNIQIMINAEKRHIVIKPSTSKEDEILCWKSNSNNTNFKKFKCINLASHLFSQWGLNTDCKYKTNGRLVQSDHKVMLLFDFTNVVAYERIKKPKESK